jgi:homoserine O-acetyltransferase
MAQQELAQPFLSDQFGGNLFEKGNFDATKYFIILTDDGHGKSSKPSDGMRMKFPKYNYDDMVLAI